MCESLNKQQANFALIKHNHQAEMFCGFVFVFLTELKK